MSWRPKTETVRRVWIYTPTVFQVADALYTWAGRQLGCSVIADERLGLWVLFFNERMPTEREIQAIFSEEWDTSGIAVTLLDVGVKPGAALVEMTAFRQPRAC